MNQRITWNEIDKALNGAGTGSARARAVDELLSPLDAISGYWKSELHSAEGDRSRQGVSEWQQTWVSRVAGTLGEAMLEVVSCGASHLPFPDPNLVSVGGAKLHYTNGDRVYGRDKVDPTLAAALALLHWQACHLREIECSRGDGAPIDAKHYLGSPVLEGLALTWDSPTEKVEGVRKAAQYEYRKVTTDLRKKIQHRAGRDGVEGVSAEVIIQGLPGTNPLLVEIQRDQLGARAAALRLVAWKSELLRLARI
jgi:hypothetical protein